MEIPVIGIHNIGLDEDFPLSNSVVTVAWNNSKILPTHHSQVHE